MRTGFTKKHPPKTTWHKGKLYGTFYRKFHAFGGLFGQQSVSDQSSAVANVILKYVSIVSRGIARILGGGGGGGGLNAKSKLTSACSITTPT